MGWCASVRSGLCVHALEVFRVFCHSEADMPNETRVNLKHLLEDLRDAYASPVEEVIVTELIANALDGGASRIRLETDVLARTFRCIDNGNGMNRVALRSYHNIAASTKERGAGIGFAGVGAKLSLLVAEKVVTESRGKHGAQGAAEWFLKNTFRAPWKFVPFSGVVEDGKGTAVTIVLAHDTNTLLDSDFLIKTVQRHFYPLVSQHEAMVKILNGLYRKPVEIIVNGKKICVEPLASNVRSFFVHLGKSRKSVGGGFIERSEMDENFWHRLFGHDAVRSGDFGLRISTYGKVIKGGWEWLGLAPKHPELLSGVVEVPMLSEILTTNKSDFLSDPASLKKYYEVRKAVQRAVLPVLRDLGEIEEKKGETKTPSSFKPLTQDIEGALSLMADAFPELEALVGEHWRRRLASEGKGGKRQARGQVEKVSDGLEETSVESDKDLLISTNRVQRGENLQEDASGEREKRVRQPGMEIVFEAFSQESERTLLGKLVEEKVIINTAHPAWLRVQSLGQEPYHVLLTVALTLGEYLQSPQGMSAFVSDFLKAWSEASQKSGRLL